MSQYDAARARELLEIVSKATPVDLSTAQLVDDGGAWECPMCGGEGYCHAEEYTNIDTLPLTVQFFGIGEHFGSNQKAWDTLPDLAAQLAAAAAEIDHLTVTRKVIELANSILRRKLTKAERDRDRYAAQIERLRAGAAAPWSKP